MKNSPGSPFFHALFAILSNTSLALSFDAGCPVLGLNRSYGSSLTTASMNLSVIATLILKFVTSFSLILQSMNSSISGWSTLRIPMFAPRLVPPCFTASVAWLKTFIKEMGPEATPPVVRTTSFLGLNLEKEKPVPPPDLCMIAACFTDSKIPSIESSIGSTKHADNC